MNLLKYVDIEIGTKNVVTFSHGNIYPVCQQPRGMASFSIQTNDSLWFYDPLSKELDGIRLSHIPSPWIGDYGQLLFSVSNSKDDINKKNKYEKEKCILMPYELSLPFGKDCKLEVTTSVRGGIFNVVGKFLFIRTYDKTVFNIENDIITGYTTAASHKEAFELKEYFAFKPSNGFSCEVLENGIIIQLNSKNSEVKFSTSFISINQAITNLGEVENVTYSSLLESNKELWEDTLEKIVIEGEEKEKAIFYSSLYRANLFPRKFYEINERGERVHVNISNGNEEKGFLYVDNGFWDTFRTLYPLLSLTDGKEYAEICEGFLNIYKDTGWLPRWIAPEEVACMPGTLVEAVLSDCITKGLVSNNIAEEMLDAMIHNAETDVEDIRFGRKEVNKYRTLGFVPNSVRESVNETLDCAYGDYCIGKAAEYLGKKELANKYFNYSKNYINLFDSEVGFMRSKNEAGVFNKEFSPYNWGDDYTEGSAWHSTFAVYHDIEGLNKLYNGKLESKIDELFNTPPIFETKGYGQVIHEMSEMAQFDNLGQCAICNEPSFHIPYIYAELGIFEKSEYWVNKIMQTAFKEGIEGYPGDEDNGTMASWYILSYLGLYQFCTSRPEYIVIKPICKKATIKLYNGNEYVIDKDTSVSCKKSFKELINGNK